MKKIILCLAVLPFAIAGNAQTKNKTVKPKTTTSANAVTAVVVADEFNISGTMTGYPDNTMLEIMNPNNGAVLAGGNITGGKFNFKGSIPAPDFMILAVNKQPPYLRIFLDNSNITINGSKEQFENAVIKGSASHDDFVALENITKPHEQVFTQPEATDKDVTKKLTEKIEQYIQSHPSSYIAPLAIYRFHQLTADNDKLETMYNKLPVAIQQGGIGSYLANLIREAKRMPIGKPLANFSQADPDGKMISLSSLKGKYVLVDFWASWCGPCRQENPNIVSNFHKYKSKNFTVLGVSLDKSKEPWLEAIKADGLDWVHVSDLAGWSNAVAQQFEITSIPQSFLLDPDGNILAKNLRGPALEAKLAELLK